MKLGEALEVALCVLLALFAAWAITVGLAGGLK